MSISVCILCRDEEKNIENCLKSISEIADEIVIVDTGSTDRTKEIAKKFTDRIFDFKWADDFSSARNFAIDKSTKGWLFFIDADEVIAKRDAKKIIELQKENFDAFSFIQRNYTDAFGEYGWISSFDDDYEESKKCNGYVARMIIRMFRNDKRIRFEGRVHENAGNSILRMGGRIKNTLIPIHHFGSMSVNREKTRKYIEIEKKDAKSFLDYCKIGVQLHGIGDNEEAEKYLRMSIEKNPSFAYSFIELGVMLIEKKDLEEAKKVLHHAQSLADNPMTLNYLGVVYGMEKDYKKSIEYLKKAIEILPVNADFHYNLGLACFNAGMKEEAVKEMKIAVKLNPAYKEKVVFED